jgi:hypothetical protein
MFPIRRSAVPSALSGIRIRRLQAMESHEPDRFQLLKAIPTRSGASLGYLGQPLQ